MTEQQQQPYAEWSILELLGHRRLAGFVREVELAGAGMLRIDVPGPDGETVATQLYNPSAVYGLTPVTEAIARAVARQNQPEPVQRWELPGPKPSATYPLEATPDGPGVLTTPYHDPYDLEEHDDEDDEDVPL